MTEPIEANAETVADAPATDELEALLAEFDAAANSQMADPDAAAVQNQREIDLANALNAETAMQSARLASERTELERAQQQWQVERNQRDGKALVDRIRGSCLRVMRQSGPGL